MIKDIALIFGAIKAAASLWRASVLIIISSEFSKKGKKTLNLRSGVFRVETCENDEKNVC